MFLLVKLRPKCSFKLKPAPDPRFISSAFQATKPAVHLYPMPYHCNDDQRNEQKRERRYAQHAYPCATILPAHRAF